MVESNQPFVLFEVQGLKEDTFAVFSFNGREAVSSVFRYELEVASPDHDLDFATVLGKNAKLTFKRDDKERHLHGMVSRIEETTRSDEFSRFEIIFVPKLWKLGLRQDCRIFQNKSVPDIVKKVWKEAGLPEDELEIKVHGTHDPWTYCVQYRESDLAFVSRLLEQEGIFYFFESSDEKTVLRAGDDPSDHPACPGLKELPLHPAAGMVPGEEAVTRFSLSEEVRSDKFVYRDYNYEASKVDLIGDHEEEPGLKTEVFDYPGEYDKPPAGKELAKVRLQELRANRQVGTGETACLRLVPGHTLDIKGHWRSGVDGKYLVLETVQNGAQPGVLGTEGASQASFFVCSFTCMPSNVPFRPPRVTPKPIVRGAQTAVVVGPSGEEIHTENGCIRVQFHWDRVGQKNEESSCWIRVAQVWAGKSWGAVSIPRIGQEVLVEFLEGNPDRPIVIGCVYNDWQTSPFTDGLVSGMKSNSTPGGGGYNEISINDSKGEEKITIHGQYDLNTAIEHDESHAVHNNRSVTVDGNHSEAVKGDVTITVGGTHTETITGDTKITVSEGKHEHTVSAGTSTCKANGDVKIESETAVLHVTAATEIKLEVGKSKLLMKSDGSIQLSGVDLAIDGKSVNLHGSSVTSKADADHNTQGANVISEGSATNIVKGGMVMLNP